MIVTRLEELEHSKVKVYIDEAYVFMLLQKDIGHYKLTKGEEITPALYDKILYDTVLHRAKMKVLSLLKFMDRTEAELRRKLSDAGYQEEIIDKAIAYATGYGYVNDKRLAAAYIRSRMQTKSRMVIKLELRHKGVDSELIDTVLQEEYACEGQEDAELNAIKKAIEKKTKSPESLTIEQKQKLTASLYRKGFEVSKIRQILS